MEQLPKTEHEQEPKIELLKKVEFSDQKIDLLLEALYSARTQKNMYLNEDKANALRDKLLALK